MRTIQRWQARIICLAVLAISMILASAAPGPARAAANFVWWEGESAFETNFNRGAFAAKTLDRPEELSGGDWLDTGGKVPAGGFYAKWKVQVPSDGKYQFYVRKFWHHGPFQWHFDAAEWRASGKPGLLDNVELKKFIGANWISLGEVELKTGERTFEVRLDAKEGEDVPGAFDCFLLIQGPFTPSGKLKPGEKLGKAMPGFFAFEPDADAFQDSPLDLRRLNDKVAGDRGFLTKKGMDLVFEKGRSPSASGRSTRVPTSSRWTRPPWTIWRATSPSTASTWCASTAPSTTAPRPIPARSTRPTSTRCTISSRR